MKTVFVVAAGLLLLAFLILLVMLLLLFRQVICRPPVRPVLSREDADKPDQISKDWEPYREMFQEGKRVFCEADRERVTIETYDGHTLVGYLMRPEGPVKGCLLLMHGFHGCPYHDFGPVLPFYLKQNYMLLLPDERAHGESGGKFLTFGIRERFDCRDWSVYLSERFGEDMPIFLDGISMGATVVLMASGLELPKNVRGIIADCGFTSPYEIMKHVLKHGMHLPVFPILPLAGVLCRAAGFGLKEYSTLDAMKGNKLPVCFVHGLEDTFVPSYMTRENFEACQAPKKMMLVEGAGHGLSYLMKQQECEDNLAAFLNQYGQDNGGTE